MKASGATKNVRWIARDSAGRELIAYQPTETAARALFGTCGLLQGEFSIRRAKDEPPPPPAIDRRITS